MKLNKSADRVALTFNAVMQFLMPGGRCEPALSLADKKVHEYLQKWYLGFLSISYF